MKNNFVDKNKEIYENLYSRKLGFWFAFGVQQKKKTIKYILKKLKIPLKNKKVLDIGFGSGDMLFIFDNSCELYGIEISENAVERCSIKAKKLGYKHDFRVVDLSIKLPLWKEKFDVIICSHVLEHIPNDKDIIKWIAEHLSNSGIAIIAVPINEKKISQEEDNENELHYREYTPMEFNNKLNNQNLEVIIDESIANDSIDHFLNSIRRKGKIFVVISKMLGATFSIMPFPILSAIDTMFNKFYPYENYTIVVKGTK
ncbi:hypothetical protein MSIBF_A10009 [groundwater metagenome]|uniref:Methyltransferase domain-containing protein n=1 Tax=groundwater metagenome TaxID=717931 RepID=A0A098E6J0_9ZZZZ